MSKTRHFIKRGLYKAELEEFFSRELEEEGFSGIEINPTQLNTTEIVIRAIRSNKVIGLKGRREKELRLALIKRFRLPPNSIKLKVVKIGQERGLDANLQAEEIKQRLLEGQAVRRVCYRVLRNVMFNGAKGCEIIVSGKLRAQRAKDMKFRKGKILRVGMPAETYVSKAIRHVKLRQGVLGVRVKIVKAWNPMEDGADLAPPGEVIVTEPKEDMSVPAPANYGDQED